MKEILRWGGGPYFKKEGQECVPISSVSIPPDGSSSVQPQSQRERWRFDHVPGGSSVVLWDIRGPLIEAIRIYCITRISDHFPVRSGISLDVHPSVVPNLKMTDDLVLLALSNCHLLLLEGFEAGWEGDR